MLDSNGKEYLESLDSTSWKLDVWDRLRLIGQHKNLERRTRVAGTHTFETRSKGFDYEPEQGVRVHVRPVRASDIASMNGIADRSLFSLNVRSGLGRTRVNRDLERAVRETSKHNQFVLFHNGVTIICKKLQVVRSKIKITDYSVVNGCQSAIAFFENKSRLSDQLQVVARFIEVGDNDALAEDVTYRSNNQNGINLRDLKSNDRIQIALRKQFENRFGGRIEYVIKAGEEQGSSAIIRNDRAGQWIMALYLDEPYNAHQKYRLFGSEYERVFGRDVTAEKIYPSHLTYESVEFSVESVEDPLIRAYQLTKLILLGIIGEMLRKDTTGKELLTRPEQFLPAKEDAVKDALRKLAALLVPDFNYYIKERKHAEGFYDYKSAFKSSDEYQALSREMQRNYDKAIVKHPEDSFERIFASQTK
jgi:hypothetical protein